MADGQRKRSRNFTEFEKELLLDIVMKYLHTIENKKTDAKTIQEKNECWQRVTEEFNAKNFNGNRSYPQLKMLYDNLKKNARKATANERMHRSKVAAKLISMLTTPYDLSLIPDTTNLAYCHLKFNDSEPTFNIDDTDKSSEALLKPLYASNSKNPEQECSLKIETDDMDPMCSEPYESLLVTNNESSTNKGYKRRLNHMLEELHSFMKKKSDDSHMKKKLHDVRVEQAEIELQIKKVELEIKIKELEIRKKELELKTKELELKNKQLDKLND